MLFFGQPLTDERGGNLAALATVENGLDVYEKLNANRGILIGLTTREPPGNLPRERGPFTPGKVGDGKKWAPVVRRPVM